MPVFLIWVIRISLLIIVRAVVWIRMIPTLLCNGEIADHGEEPERKGGIRICNGAYINKRRQVWPCERARVRVNE